MTVDSAINRALNEARKQLLDLGMRNRMLDAKLGSPRGKRVEIVDERSEDVFDLLAVQKVAMTFDSRELRESSEGIDDKEGSPTPVNPDRWTDRRLQTDLPADKLERVLLELYYDAQTYEQEQGVNILFLAIGFLKWFEADASKGARFAPLILLPVELERGAAGGKFKLRGRDEEILGNHSLAARLKQDFGILLPVFEGEEASDVTAYLAAIRQLVRGLPRFEVLENAMAVAFFSFAKFLMYRDLDPSNWPEGGSIASHPVVQTIFGGSSAGFEPPLCDDDDPIDPLLHPREVLHVTDADSSQAIVIEEIRKGRSLVVQGPPGTGKSQTITNVLAAAVHAGKTVLFVAEKLAALQVVKSRLDRLQLGSVCLELHSHKANKKHVLSDLERTLQEGRPSIPKWERELEELYETRERLNRHARTMNEPIQPSGCTPFELAAELSGHYRGGVQHAPWVLQSPEKWTPKMVAHNEQLLAYLASAYQRVGEPDRHPWRGVNLSGSVLPSDAARLISIGRQVERAIASLEEAIASFARLLHTRELKVKMGRTAQDLFRFGELLKGMPELDWRSVDQEFWKSPKGTETLTKLVELGEQVRDDSSHVGEWALEGRDVADWSAVRKAISKWGQSWFRWLSRDYRRAVQILHDHAGADCPHSHGARIQLLDRLSRISRNLAELRRLGEQTGKSAFGSDWQGVQSNWEHLRQIVAWKTSVHQANPGEIFWKFVSRWTPGSPEAKRVLAQLKLSIESLTAAWAELAAAMRIRPEDFGAVEWDRVSFQDFGERLALWSSSPSSLSDWVDWNHQQEEAEKAGLSAVTEALRAGLVSCDAVVGLFRQSWCEAVWRECLRQRPWLKDGGARTMENLVSRFRELDVRRIGFARSEVAAAHYRGIPRDSEHGEMGVIRGELNKKRKHLPIRRLLSDAGRVVQKLKPVFMMSPMSIAQFLQPGAVEFDLLVIDEASQVSPEEALGAIARCRQAVVVGDTRQMPPSRFFAQSADDDEPAADAESSDLKDLESVLGLCLKSGFPERMLRWHYRSQHHSLIAVSNREFYDSRLFVVPSPGRPAGDIGLSLVHLPEATFDRGGSATNRLEARRVAAAVIQHARECPDRTLGVGTFSVAQQDAIRDELELQRQQEPGLESFFASDADEPFFVKNLENIQGDERDVIFISVGYGRDTNGVMRMHFGPLQNDGGERRLNVLISRARQRCVVFSSIRSADIDLTRAKSKGAKAFKNFLHFAEKGEFDERLPTGAGFDSEFERQVAQEIENAGFQAHSQVGSAGFRIDLAVVDPGLPGNYVLGIECDGATYHSSRWARDRDRLRESILRSRGWTLHRIWSTDWFQQRDLEVSRLLDAIRLAIENNAHTSPAPVGTSPEPAVPAIKRDTATPIAPSAKGLAEPYVEASFAPAATDLTSTPAGIVAQDLVRVVELEGPVHKDEAFRRLAGLIGHQRLGSRIATRLEEALRLSQDLGLQKSGDFLDLAGRTEVRVRNRSEVASRDLRKPATLPPSEVETAVQQVVRENTGLTPGELYSAIARVLGFGSVTAGLRGRVDEAIQSLLNSNRIATRAQRFYSEA